MNYIATITSKRQLTIPSAIFEALDLFTGEKVLITAEDDLIKISRFHHLLNKLAGSVRIPKKFKGLSTEEMISKARQEHFKL